MASSHYRPFASLALAICVAACGATPVPPPSGTSVAAPPTATSVAAPPTASAEPEPWLSVDVPQPPAVADAPTLAPGYLCHPCHELAEDDLLGVGAWPEGFLAVGVRQPPSVAVAFTSPDGMRWTPLAGFPAQEGTAGLAVAASGTRTVVVGKGPDGAASWASTGGAWTAAPAQAGLAAPSKAGAMTSVVAFGGGFVAGGYRDDPANVRSAAAVWRSDDGLTWRLDDAAGAFESGRIWGLAVRGGVVVAVGTSGDPVYGPAAAWRWTAADGWRRATLAPDDGGAMHAVAATATGFVAVGLNAHDNGGRVWTSTDGLAWTALPDGAVFHYFDLGVRMQAVAAGPGGLFAGGWRSDAGKGSAVAWSADAQGGAWTGPTWEAPFSGGEISGVAVSGGTVVAVGRLGYPDWNYAAAWLLVGG